jgi:hypothetical protein
MWKPFPLKIFRRKRTQLPYIRTSLASIDGDDPERSQTLDTCTIIFSIEICNTSTKAGHRGFTFRRVLNLGNHCVTQCYRRQGDDELLSPQCSNFSGSVTPVFLRGHKSPAGYSLQHGIIQYKDRIWIGNNQEAQHVILLSLHDCSVGEHSSFLGTYQRIKVLFSWPKMKEHDKTNVRKSSVCQQAPLPIPT